MKFLTNPIVTQGLALLVGWLNVYWPGLKRISNEVTPYVAAITSFILQLLSAASGTQNAVYTAAFTPMTPVYALCWPATYVGAAFGFGGIFVPIINAAWQGILSKLIHDAYGKVVLEGPLKLTPTSR